MADWSEKARLDTRYRPETRVSRLLLGISDSKLLSSTMSAPPSSFLLHAQHPVTPLPPPPDDEPPRGVEQRDAGPNPSSQITQNAALWFNVIDAECSKSHIITGLQVTEHQTETRRGLVGGGMGVACSGLDAYGADHGP
ncbi:hypothetical protein RhiTH_009263 [Rhizoctonia solani]